MTDKKFIIYLISIAFASAICAFCAFAYITYHCRVQGQCRIQAAEEVNQIKLTIQMPKRLYDRDESIPIQVAVKNKRNEPARLFPSGENPALEFTYQTKDGIVYWHEQHRDIAYNEITLEPGGKYQVEIIIPPPDQPYPESGQTCVKVMVNYPGGKGSYGIGTCLTYNNRPH